MAVTWNKVVAGPAPWEAEYSQVSRGGGLSATTHGKGFSSRVTSSYISGGVTISRGITDDGLNYTDTASFSGANGTTTASGSTVISQKVAGVSLNGTTSSTFERGGEVTENVRVGTPYVVTLSYRSGTGVLNVVRSRYRSTTETYTRSVITNHSAASLSSTTTTSQGYTQTVRTYVTVNTTTSSAETASYVSRANHLQQVVQAAPSEYLREVTATTDQLTGLSVVLGPTAMQITRSAVAGQRTYGVAIGQAFSNIATANVGAGAVDTTITVARETEIPVTIGASDGWVGGTETRQEYVTGIITEEAEFLGAPLEEATYAEGHISARLTYKATSVVSLSYVFSDTLTGLNATGGRTEHAVEYLAPAILTFDTTVFPFGDVASELSDSWGYSVTEFTSPEAGYQTWYNNPDARLSRLERAFGYQHASDLGPEGGRGASITANSSFFIGTGNYVQCDPNGVLLPAPWVSTASTDNSSYSFALGSLGQWSVTAFRTDTSSSTLTIFTATVGTGGAAEIFINQSANWYEGGGIVLGGANALAGIPQIVTFGGGGGMEVKGAGWKYTLKDESSTTAYTTHLEPYTTTNIGTSMIALESFSAAALHSPVSEGPIGAMTLRFNQ